MNTENLKIIVVGPVNSGKSTISSLIKKSLEEYGIKCDILNEDAKNRDINIDEKIQNISKQNVNIVIEQITRQGKY